VQLPEWWDWPFVLAGHAEYRMEERGLHEIELRTMLHGPVAVRLTGASGRWEAVGRIRGTTWKVILEPDADTNSVLVITAFKISR